MGTCGHVQYVLLCRLDALEDLHVDDVNDDVAEDAGKDTSGTFQETPFNSISFIYCLRQQVIKLNTSRAKAQDRKPLIAKLPHISEALEAQAAQAAADLGAKDKGDPESVLEAPQLCSAWYILYKVLYVFLYLELRRRKKSCGRLCAKSILQQTMQGQRVAGAGVEERAVGEVARLKP